MKKSICILLLFVIIYGCITDKTDQLPKITADMIDPENPPVIEFSSAEFNFDTIAMGATVSHTFTFTNAGKTPLIIHSVKAACGCTVLKGWPKHPILPGDSGEIPIEFSPKSPGAQRKYISIIANTRPATNRLFLKGQVVGI
ncbi:MAG: hypothetical protein CL853_03720 [Crocinitomicaceae bacterium]|nr:hypothetical protein [Crocinitomicaceae bacterium]|tara:strand:- start:423 stop:848 length:426 start_codon:yes stop_codon:yes gene_type:complete